MRTGLFLAAACAATLAACGGDDPGRDAAPPAPAARPLVRLGPAPALAALPGGDVLAGEQLTGRVLRVTPAGRITTAFPRLRVGTGGQRGLLGLARRGARTFAAWTRPDRVLVVGELRRGRPPVVRWRGPRSATLANGGHLAVAPDGDLVLGIGDLQRGGQRGRLLRLDPDGPATQEPHVLSTGWNNPFAFTVTADGALWVADNAPGRVPERLARGDRGRPAAVTDLPRGTAPSGLVALRDGALAACSFLTGRLDRYVRDGDGWRRAGTIARGCRYGAVVTTRGTIVVAGDRGLATVAG